ncbi:MAG: single-stranded DNA-binding protein [Alistipes sp.]|nr:single-stranded DNA-binding protein [Alistipes sp.]
MINKVILVGNVGADPEVRSLESGVKTARVRIATTERFYNRQTNETTEQTEWHTVIFWRGLADVVDKYVRKGSQIYVEGSIHYRDWQGNDGQRHFVTEITASELKLLGRRTESNQTQPQPQQYGQPSQPPQYVRQPEPQYTAPQYPAPQPAPAPAPAPQPAAPAEDDDLPF